MKNASNVTGFARLYALVFFFFFSSAPKTAQNCHELTVKPVFMRRLLKSYIL